MIKKMLKWNKGDLPITAAVIFAFFVLLEGVVAVVMLTVRPDNAAGMGGAMLPVVAGFVVLFTNTNNVLLGFELMLRHSVTRRRALWGLLLTLTVETLCALLVGWGLGWLDRLITNAWLSLPWVTTVQFEFMFPLWGVLAAVVPLVLLTLGMGAVMQRFGRKAFWILWAVWMVFTVASTQVDWEALFTWMGAGQSGATLVLGGAAVLAAGGWGAWSLLHTSVRQQ